MIRAPAFPDDPRQQVRIRAEQLKPALVKLLTKRSVFQFDASTIVDRMLEADARGLSAYGCARVVDILTAIDAGDVDPRGRVLTVKETPAIAVLDGSRAAGAVAATKAVELACAKAREVGVGVVVVGNSQPLGAAGVFALLAASQGLIGHCLTSTGSASVAGPTGHSAAIGNSAMAWALPTGTESPPLVFDTALGRSSWGKLVWLKKYGIPIPDGILATGNSASGELSQAVMFPGGGPLGFGLSIVNSVLAGPLAGGKSPIHKRRSSTADDSQHFIQVMDIARFADINRFYKEVQTTLADLRAIESESTPLRICGDSAHIEFERFQRDGVRLHRTDWAAIQHWAGKLKVELPGC